jgi:hypothetical protein
MAKPRSNPRPRQVVSEEVQRSLLELIQRKFYQGQAVHFAKHRKDLLHMVIYWPAREWFRPKALSVSNGRYLQILSAILIEAAAFQRGPLYYPPAWLGKSVQDHFAIQGERYYAEAKSARSLADHALATLGKLTPREHDDVVERFAEASRLLDASKTVAKRAVKAAPKSPRNDQLTLL